ncbi:MAG TPA: hypothetical protein VFA26_07650 [Gemmataceae bacterium]|nr:hypothetical protein [Gemmataceae bacterium]
MLRLDRSVAALIGPYTARWNIETIFQEMRRHLGRETARGWCEKAVLRAQPCLFGLPSVVALLYASLPKSKRLGGGAWPGKAVVTFSAALAAVRRWLWADREVIFATLAPAA